MNFHFIPFDLTWSHLVNLCMYHCSDDYNPVHHIDTYGMWLWYVHAISKFVFSLSSYSHCFWFSPALKSEHYHFRFTVSKRYEICKYNPITSAPYRIGSLTDINLTKIIITTKHLQIYCDLLWKTGRGISKGRDLSAPALALWWTTSSTVPAGPSPPAVPFTVPDEEICGPPKPTFKTPQVEWGKTFSGHELRKNKLLVLSWTWPLFQVMCASNTGSPTHGPCM